MSSASLVAAAQVIEIRGNLDCGSWLSARKNNEAVAYEHYMLGVVDGMVAGSLVNVWAGKGGGVSNQQFFYWLDNYCRKNPLSTTLTAADDFSNEMSEDRFRKRIRK